MIFKLQDIVEQESYQVGMIHIQDFTCNQVMRWQTLCEP